MIWDSRKVCILVFSPLVFFERTAMDNEAEYRHVKISYAAGDACMGEREVDLLKRWWTVCHIVWLLTLKPVEIALGYARTFGELWRKDCLQQGDHTFQVYLYPANKVLVINIDVSWLTLMCMYGAWHLKLIREKSRTPPRNPQQLLCRTRLCHWEESSRCLLLKLTRCRCHGSGVMSYSLHVQYKVQGTCVRPERH